MSKRQTALASKPVISTNFVAFDDEFEVTNPPVAWSVLSAIGNDSFVVVARDASGLVGCFSPEYQIVPT